MPEQIVNKITASISIVAANYNNGKFIDDFILSIANSDVLPKELIIVDDGSTDESREIIGKYRHFSWLKPIYFKTNRGFTKALNEGVKQATGRYIMRADPDDVFLPDRIGKQFEFMETKAKVDVLGCNVIYFRGAPENTINVSNFPTTQPEIYRKYTLGEHGVQHPTVIVKASVMKKYSYGDIYPGEDYELFARMIRDGHIFANLKTPLYKMRVHKGSSTSNLKFEGIRQTFRFRDQIFGSRTSDITMRRYYSHIKNYRKYQLADKKIRKYYFLLISSLSYPKKLINRLIHA